MYRHIYIFIHTQFISLSRTDMHYLHLIPVLTPLQPLDRKQIRVAYRYVTYYSFGVIKRAVTDSLAADSVMLSLWLRLLVHLNAAVNRTNSQHVVQSCHLQIKTKP
jgi:hypothetical protein